MNSPIHDSDRCPRFEYELPFDCELPFGHELALDVAFCAGESSAELIDDFVDSKTDLRTPVESGGWATISLDSAREDLERVQRIEQARLLRDAARIRAAHDAASSGTAADADARLADLRAAYFDVETSIDSWRKRCRRELSRIELDGEIAPRSLLACTRRRIASWPSALDLARAAWMLDPSFELRIEIARALTSEGSYRRAEEVYRKLWKDACCSSERTTVLSGLAALAERAGDFPRAFERWTRAGELNPGDPFAVVSTFALAIALEHDESAHRASRRVIELEDRSRISRVLQTRASIAPASAGTPRPTEESRRLRLDFIAQGDPFLSEICLALS